MRIIYASYSNTSAFWVGRILWIIYASMQYVCVCVCVPCSLLQSLKNEFASSSMFSQFPEMFSFEIYTFEIELTFPQPP